MNNLLLILLFYLGRRITARFINPKEPEVSKVDYQLNADSSDVRGVATIFDTCLNLGHLFLHMYANLKICMVIRTQICFPQIMPYKYRAEYGTFLR